MFYKYPSKNCITINNKFCSYILYYYKYYAVPKYYNIDEMFYLKLQHKMINIKISMYQRWINKARYLSSYILNQ